MNTERKSFAPNRGARIKKLVLPVDTSNTNLVQDIKRMFDMAKSSGQELDLTFCHKQVETV